MSDPFKDFKFEWRTDAQNNEAIWFLNPWTNGWEELAVIKWCCHPPEKLQEIDAFFEALQSSWVNALQLTESNRQLREQVKVLELKNRASLANNLCPDHRDKQVGKPCLACEIEQLREELEILRRARDDARDIIVNITNRKDRLKTALVAAKEVLRQIATHSQPATIIARDALARIAECEKET